MPRRGPSRAGPASRRAGEGARAPELAKSRAAAPEAGPDLWLPPGQPRRSPPVPARAPRALPKLTPPAAPANSALGAAVAPGPACRAPGRASAASERPGPELAAPAGAAGSPGAAPTVPSSPGLHPSRPAPPARSGLRDVPLGEGEGDRGTRGPSAGCKAKPRARLAR